MTAVTVEHVWKRYRLGGVGGLFSRRPREDLWALRDISISVAAGQSLGIIGHNGAGKTTLLKLLARITKPTRGQVHTEGRVASLINLGAGFHQELTGRENIFLNGVILGLSRRQVRERFDEIVEFADLHTYLDTPLKRYSSGMAARLGFSVAAHVDPDVLLVDEVLSVGDVGFQDRSIRKMLSFRDSGRAILFVSHNLSAVEMMCERTIWLDHGSIRMHGDTADVVRAYLDAVDERLLADAAVADADVQVTLAGAAGNPCDAFEYGDALHVLLKGSALRAQRVTVTVRGDYGPLFSARSPMTAAELVCVFESLPLLPGLYRVDVQLDEWVLPQTMAAFRITTDLSDFGSASVVGTTKSRGGFLAVAYDWQVRSADGSHSLPGLHVPTIMAPQ